MRIAVTVVVLLTAALCMPALADIPLVINHQGMVKVEGVPYTGQGQFKFGFYEATGLTWLWTNDGNQLGASISQAPFNAVTVDVTKGNYSVRLGDTGLGANMKAIPSSVFNGDNVLLRVYFNDGVNGEQPLLPDQPVTSGAYAFHAQTADTVPGYIDGGILSNDETDPTNSLHITGLICRDDQNKANITVPAMSKRVDANWAAGDGNGGLDAGTIGTSRVLVYVYAIGDSTGQNPGDILFSKSGLTPGLPDGYDIKRFIGARCWLSETRFITFKSRGSGRERWTTLGETTGIANLVSTGGDTNYQEIDASKVVPPAHANMLFAYCSLSNSPLTNTAGLRMRFWGGPMAPAFYETDTYNIPYMAFHTMVFVDDDGRFEIGTYGNCTATISVIGYKESL